MLVTAAGVLAGEAVGWIEVTSTSQLDEVDFIFQVGPLSFVVALLAGAAGMLSLVSAKSAALVGVFISVTTFPPPASPSSRPRSGTGPSPPSPPRSSR